MKYIKTRNEMLTLLPKNIIIAELGVFIGEYSQKIIDTTQPKQFYMVDIFADAPAYSGDKDGENGIGVPNLYTEYLRLIEKYKEQKNIIVCRESTTGFLQRIPYGFLDAVYIDADHSYHAVYQDLLNSNIKISHGLIMGHDYDKEGVRLAVDRFCWENNFKIEYLTEDKCPSYIIIK